MEEETKILIGGIVIGILSCAFVLVVYFGITDTHYELGNAICDEEYDLQYDSYISGVLKCKPKEIIEPYDGISVEIGGE